MTSSGDSAPFPSTHWSIIRAAGEVSDPRTKEALAALCQRYWRPVYGYVRRKVRDAQLAQDFTQSFFVRVLEGNLFQLADSNRGRFRSLLLTSLCHFLAHEREYCSAQKRGGGLRVLSLDFASVEGNRQFEPSVSETPEQIFEREWAAALLANTLARLQQDYQDAGKEAQFELLKPFLTLGDAAAGYPTLASKLGSNVGAVRALVYRMRKRYRELLRSEIAQTVESEGEIESEIAALFRAFSG